MSSTPRELAEKVIAAFRENLTPETRDKITESEYHILDLMIREAISDGMWRVSEQVAATLKNVRAGIERPPIDL